MIVDKQERIRWLENQNKRRENVWGDGWPPPTRTRRQSSSCALQKDRKKKVKGDEKRFREPEEKDGREEKSSCDAQRKKTQFGGRGGRGEGEKKEGEKKK